MWVLFVPVAYVSVFIGVMVSKRSINTYCHKHIFWDPEFDEFEGGTLWDEVNR